MNISSDEQALADKIQAFRHEMHRFPELSNQEHQTTQRIHDALKEAGIAILPLPLATGLVAEIKGQQDGPLILLRSDIDALPIEEESGVAFVSENNGVMHACGHDFHASAVLGAAILLQQNIANLKGTVRVLFQAAEETGLGAPALLATGACDNALAILGIHNDPTLPVGVVGSKEGALTAGVDRFEINIAAKGAHAAKPHEGNDPLIIIAQIINATQSIISRNVSSVQNAVVSITQVHSGSTWNVIPDTAYLEGTVRTFQQAIREQIEQRLRQILDGIAATFNAQIELLWHPGPPSVINTGEWVDLALMQAEKSGFAAIRVEASPIGEDFSFYQQKIPGVFVMIGSGGPYALHHPKFRVDDKALYPTARYLAQLAEAALNEYSEKVQ